MDVIRTCQNSEFLKNNLHDGALFSQNKYQTKGYPFLKIHKDENEPYVEKIERGNSVKTSPLIEITVIINSFYFASLSFTNPLL